MVRPKLGAAALLAALSISIVVFIRIHTMDNPSHSPPRPIKISLGQTVRDFLRANEIPAEAGRKNTPDKNHYAVAVDVVADTDPIIFGDHWIRLTFENGLQGFELPPGRTLFIDQEAGRIKSFSFTPFDQPHPLEETNRLSKQLMDSFLAKGWVPRTANSMTFALTDRDEDFQRGGEKIYAQLKDHNGNLLNFTVADLAKAPSNPSYLLAPAPLRPQRDVPVYVIRIGLYWAHRNNLSYGDLIYPRRLFVQGTTDKPLPLRAWVDDPDWTPQKHGMIDLGGTGESKRWSLPQK